MDDIVQNLLGSRMTKKTIYSLGETLNIRV